MSPAIHYEAVGDVNTIKRDEFHFDKEDLLVAFDTDRNTDVIERKVTIPKDRIVRIDG